MSLVSFIILSTVLLSNSIEVDDKILYVGDRHIVDGQAFQYGFVSLINKELMQYVDNLSIDYIYDENNYVQPQLIQHFNKPSNHPNITIITLGTQFVESGILSIEYFENYLNLTLVNVNETLCREVYILSPFVYGDRYDHMNPYDEYYEEIQAVGESLSKLYNYTYVDVRNLFLKYLQRYNIENLNQSVLTYDGFHLHPIGHYIIATEVLEAMGYTELTTIPKLQIYTHDEHIKMMIRANNLQPQNFYHSLAREVLETSRRNLEESRRRLYEIQDNNNDDDINGEVNRINNYDNMNMNSCIIGPCGDIS